MEPGTFLFVCLFFYFLGFAFGHTKTAFLNGFQFNNCITLALEYFSDFDSYSSHNHVCFSLFIPNAFKMTPKRICFLVEIAFATQL